MAVSFLNLGRLHQEIRPALDQAYKRVMDSGWFITGPEVQAFESEFATFSGVKHCVGVGNGLDALVLLLRAYGIGPGDEVLVPSNTFIATWLAVSQCGATPVPVEPDPQTHNMDPAGLEAAVTPRTKAVIAVDLFGQMAPIEQVMEAAQGCPVIEDAAQSIGASRVIDGARVMAGQAAAIGTFSFFPSKNLGGYGDGGMMVTQDDALFETLMKLRTHGSRRTYYHEIVGYNSRLDSLQAAVLSAKLPHLKAWSAARRRNAAYYDAAFADIGEITAPYIDAANESIYNQYTIRVSARDALQAHLKALGIGNAIYYPLPLHLQPCFAHLGSREGAFPESERAAREVLSLPVFPELRPGQLDEVIDAVRSFFGR